MCIPGYISPWSSEFSRTCCWKMWLMQSLCLTHQYNTVLSLKGKGQSFKDEYWTLASNGVHSWRGREKTSMNGSWLFFCGPKDEQEHSFIAGWKGTFPREVCDMIHLTGRQSDFCKCSDNHLRWVTAILDRYFISWNRAGMLTEVVERAPSLHEKENQCEHTLCWIIVLSFLDANEGSKSVRRHCFHWWLPIFLNKIWSWGDHGEGSKHKTEVDGKSFANQWLFLKLRRSVSQCDVSPQFTSSHPLQDKPLYNVEESPV